MIQRVEVTLVTGLGEKGDVEEVIISFNNKRRFWLRSNGHLEEWKEPSGWEKVEAST